MNVLCKLGLVLAANVGGKDFDIVEIEEKPNRYRGIWAPWGEWSDVCKCIDKEEVIRSGKRNSLRRRRECPCPAPDGCHFYCGFWYDHYDEKPCVPQSHWSQWGNWSACSVSVGKGKQQRVRECKSLGCTPESDCPVGNRKQERECGGVWADWGDANWDACQCRQHLTHTETKRRSRLCNCLVLDPAVTDKNQTTYPTVIETKEYGDCDVPCGPEESSYDVSGVSNGDGSFELVSCKASDEAKWDQWEAWGTCSVTAGLGEQTRKHSCLSLGCESKADCTQMCSDDFVLVKRGNDQFCANLTTGVRGDEAFDICNEMSGYIPRPTSSSSRSNFTDDFLETEKKLLTNYYNSYWLGAKRIQVGKIFEWRWLSTGDPILWSQWYPNRGPSKQTNDFLMNYIHKDHGYHDRHGSYKTNLFCVQVNCNVPVVLFS